jgi:hypothetical protein
MATTSKKKTSVFGLNAAALAGFALENSLFSHSGHNNLSVTRAGTCNQVRKLSERIGSLGVEDRLLEQGMGFLKLRKSADSKNNLFESLCSIAAGSAADLDLGWITPTFPRVVSLMNTTATDITTRRPTPVPPLFMAFDYPTASDVNNMVDGQVFRAYVMFMLEFEDAGTDLLLQCARARALTWLANAASPVLDLSILKARISVAKVTFQFVNPSSPAAVNPSWFFDIPDPAKPVTDTWPLVPLSQNTAPTVLPDFTADELDIATWKRRLLTMPFGTVTNAYKVDHLFARDSMDGLTTDKVSNMLASCVKTRKDLFEAAAKEFPDQAAALKPGNADSAKILYRLLRYTHAGAAVSPPLVKDIVTDGNIVAR